MRLWFLGFLLVASPAFAANSKENSNKSDHRPGQGGLTFSTGSADYRGVSGELRAGLSPIWRLDLLGSSTHSGASGDTHAYSLGADVNLGDAWNARMALQGGREPNDLSSFGFTAGGTFELSTLWDADNGTFVGLDVERNRFAQNAKGSARRVLTKAFIQKAVHLELEQEFSDRVSVSLNLDKYTYDENAATINAAVGSRRRSATGSTDSYMSGFPDAGAELRLDWQPDGNWTLSPHAGRVRSVLNGQITKNLGLGVSRMLSSMVSVSFDYTHSRPDTDPQTDIFGLGARIFF